MADAFAKAQRCQLTADAAGSQSVEKVARMLTRDVKCRMCSAAVLDGVKKNHRVVQDRETGARASASWHEPSL